MRVSLSLIGLATLGAPQVAAAQPADPMPGPATVVEAVEQEDLTSLVKLFGNLVELTDPSFSGLKGYLEMRRMVDKLKGCSASHSGEVGQNVSSFMIAFDCPRYEWFEVGADCATEDFKLLVSRRLQSEASRPGMTSHVAVLAPVRSNEGDCYRPLVVRPDPSVAPHQVEPRDK